MQTHQYVQPSTLNPQPLPPTPGVPPVEPPDLGLSNPHLIRLEVQEPKIRVEVDTTMFGNQKVRAKDWVLTSQINLRILPVTLADGSTSFERAIDPVGSYEDAVRAAADVARASGGYAAIINQGGQAGYGVAALGFHRETLTGSQVMPDARTRSRNMPFNRFRDYVNQGVLHAAPGTRGGLLHRHDYKAGAVPALYVTTNDVMHVDAVSRSSNNVAALVGREGVFDLRAGDLRSEPTEFTDAERADFSAIGMPN